MSYVAVSDTVKRAVLSILSAFLDTVKEAGPRGAPSGPMYAAAMAQGLTLEQYEAIMRALVNAGKVRKEGHVFYFVCGL
jgi:hypothetical protein